MRSQKFSAQGGSAGWLVTLVGGTMHVFFLIFDSFDLRFTRAEYMLQKESKGHVFAYGPKAGETFKNAFVFEVLRNGILRYILHMSKPVIMLVLRGPCLSSHPVMT